MSSENSETSDTYKYVKLIHIPDQLPTFSYEYEIYGGNNKNRPLLIRYGNNAQLRLNDLNKLKEKIIETKLKYVYPVVFSEFAKKYVNDDEVKFDMRRLFKLRIWANQLRECHRNGEHNIEDYLTYMIGCKILKYSS